MTTVKRPAAAQTLTLPYRLALNINSLEMTEEQLLQLCSDNGDLRLELTAKRELIIMPPTGGAASHRNSELTADLVIWSRQDGTEIAFDSNGGFTLPNGAVRAPDASWILLSRWETLTPAQQDRFAPICPDFVIELRSPSDGLRDVQGKMAEYIENGVRLGWLIDPQDGQAHIYHPGDPIEILDSPEVVLGDPVLPGFVLELKAIW